jgi:hypothetical protein
MLKRDKLPLATLLCILAPALVSCGAAPELTRGPIEAVYAQPGAFEVSSFVVKDGANKNLYKIYHPVELTSGHPIIVWGNGTHALPSNYDELLTHLATWGFVVIDTYSTTTGTGAEILGAAEYMAARNDAPDSPFFGKLDPDRIGAAGHSQGSTGVINAQTRFERGPRIKTVVSIALPDLRWCDPEDKYDTSLLTASFFIMGGTGDGIVSPTSTNTKAYGNTPPGLPAAMAMAEGAGHTAIEGDGSHHRGYLTAWMRYQLANDPTAREAFAGDTAELKNQPRWRDVALKNLE